MQCGCIYHELLNFPETFLFYFLRTRHAFTFSSCWRFFFWRAHWEIFILHLGGKWMWWLNQQRRRGFSFLFFLVNKIVFTYLLLCLCEHVCLCISTATPPQHHTMCTFLLPSFFSFIKIYLFFSPLYPTCIGIST